MPFANMPTAALASLLRRSHAEMHDGATQEIRAEGERTYRAAKAYLAAKR